MKIDIIILAAGESTRFGSQKQNYLFAGGQQMWQIIVRKLVQIAAINQIIIVRSKKVQIALGGEFKNIRWVFGTSIRTESMIRGLSLVTTEKVIIHDCARPFLSLLGWQKFVCEGKKTANLISATWLTNSLKKIIQYSADGLPIRTKTVPKKMFLATTTPQMFQTAILTAASKHIRNSDDEITDELELVERYCNDPKMKYNFFFHNEPNPKITFSADFQKYCGLIT